MGFNLSRAGQVDSATDCFRGWVWEALSAGRPVGTDRLRGGLDKVKISHADLFNSPAGEETGGRGRGFRGRGPVF